MLFSEKYIHLSGGYFKI